MKAAIYIIPGINPEANQLVEIPDYYKTSETWVDASSKLKLAWQISV